MSKFKVGDRVRVRPGAPAADDGVGLVDALDPKDWWDVDEQVYTVEFSQGSMPYRESELLPADVFAFSNEGEAD